MFQNRKGRERHRWEKCGKSDSAKLVEFGGKTRLVRINAEVEVEMKLFNLLVQDPLSEQ